MSLLGNLSLAFLALRQDQACLTGVKSYAQTSLSLNGISADRFTHPLVRNSFLLHVSGGHFAHFLSHVICSESVTSIYREDIIARPTLDLNGENITVNESLFRDIRSQTDGGAIFAIFPGDVILYQVAFLRVASDAKGGTIFFHGNNLTILSCCFTQCSADQGMAIFNARTKNMTRFGQCHCFNLSGTSYGVYSYSFVTEIKNSNFTRSQATGDGSAFYVQTVRTVDVSDSVFQENKGKSLFVTEGIYRTFEFIRCNCFSNSGDSCVNVIGYDLVLKEWAFARNTLTNLASSSSADVTLTLTDCQFDKTKDELAAPVWATFSSGCQFSVEGAVDIPVVQTGVCWDQNRYKFEEPKLYKKIIIGCVFGLCFVIVIIILIAKDCQDKKRMNELIAEHEANEGLNEHILIEENSDSDLKQDPSEQRHKKRKRKVRKP